MLHNSINSAMKETEQSTSQRDVAGSDNVELATTMLDGPASSSKDHLNEDADQLSSESSQMWFWYMIEFSLSNFYLTFSCFFQICTFFQSSIFIILFLMFYFPKVLTIIG